LRFFSFCALAVSGDPKAMVATPKPKPCIERACARGRGQPTQKEFRRVWPVFSVRFVKISPVASLVSPRVYARVSEIRSRRPKPGWCANVLQERPIPAERGDLLETRLHASAWEFDPKPSRDSGSRKERWTAAIGELLAIRAVAGKTLFTNGTLTTMPSSWKKD
jgi:hypothetical protein